MDKTTISLKFRFGQEVRRISAEKEDLTFQKLTQLLEKIFPTYSDEKEEILVKYRDDEGDLVTITSEIEFQETLRLSQEKKIIRFQLEEKIEQSGCCFKRFFGYHKKIQKENNCFLKTMCCPSSSSSSSSSPNCKQQTHCEASDDCPNPCGGRRGCRKWFLVGVVLALLFFCGRCCVLPLLIGAGIALGIRSFRRYSRCHKKYSRMNGHDRHHHPSCKRPQHNFSKTKSEDKDVKKFKEEQEVKIEPIETNNNDGDSKILKFEQSLKLLEEMGFTNRQKNIEALVSVKGRLVDAVQVLSSNQSSN